MGYAASDSNMQKRSRIMKVARGSVVIKGVDTQDLGISVEANIDNDRKQESKTDDSKNPVAMQDLERDKELVDNAFNDLDSKQNNEIKDSDTDIHKAKDDSDSRKDAGSIDLESIESIIEEARDNLPSSINIKVENRTFNISMSDYTTLCKMKMIETFDNKSLSIEEILRLLVLSIKETSRVEEKIIGLIKKHNI